MTGTEARKPTTELLTWASGFTGINVAMPSGTGGKAPPVPEGDAPDKTASGDARVPRPMPPGTKFVHGKVPGPMNHLLTVPDGFVVDVDAKTIIANSLAEYKAKPVLPKHDVSTSAQPAPDIAQSPAPDDGGGTDPIAAGGSGRSAVAAAAKAMMGRGTIHARALAGPENLRQGWEDLLEIFKLAAPGFVNQPGWVENVLKHGKEVGTTMSIPHWCGVFALYATKTGGVSVGTWKAGSGIASVSGFRPIKATDVGIGDVLVKKAQTHHAVVVAIDGDKVTVINGNSGGDSSITRSSGKLSDYDGGCYSAFVT